MKFQLLCSILILACLIGCNDPGVAGKGKSDSSEADKPATTNEQVNVILQTTKEEKLIGELAVQVSQLNQTFSKDKVDAGEVFESEIDYLGPSNQSLADLESKLASSDPSHLGYEMLEIEKAARKLNTQTERIWEGVFKDQKFDSCQIGTTGSRFEGDDFVQSTLFEGRFQAETGSLFGIKAHQDITWRKIDNQWKVVGWKQEDFKLLMNKAALFEDVTESAIPDAKTREMVQKYSHWEIMEKHSQIATPSIRHTKIQYKRFNDWESSFTFPCVSVLDWNDDGFDDFFVTDRWQPSQLLENQGDGTFKDVSEKSGLKIDELAICSLFADFDNDGEQEALIGGGLVPTRYFEKVNGVFKEDLSQKNQWKDIRFVVSGSVVDINGDGLLDVYLCTYGLGDGPPKTWVDQIIRPSEKQEFCLKMADSHYYLSRGGLPNIVLMNRNGKLQRVENLDEDLAQWRCSFQTVWNDIDSDGDLDAYICNDFAADQFLRNDTPKGEFDLQFTEFSADVIPDGKMGFGMGASWGDYNNDGNLDLYVSNMYSKAGTRILKKFPVVDERIKSSARGNFLYENNGDGSFKQVAGFGDDQQHVNKVGWSFGGQFADFNNDALMDIYVPSGFYTPPEIMKSPGDR